MKRLTKLVSWTLAGILALYSIWALDNARAQTSTTSAKYSGKRPGELMGAGTLTWRLATLAADADTSMIATALINTWNDSNTEIPSKLFVGVYWDSAAGGNTTTELRVAVNGHWVSTDAAMAAWTGPMYFFNYGVATTSTLAYITGPCKATAKGATAGILDTGLPATSGDNVISPPPYISVKIDKEGNGKHTAGYVRVEWKTFR